MIISPLFSGDVHALHLQTPEPSFRLRLIRVQVFEDTGAGGKNPLDPPTNMAFAIIRINKISSAAKAGDADAHNDRTYEVKNADPEKRHLNGEFVDVSGRPSWELANERIETMGIQPKADAVRVVEFLLTASPEFFPPGIDIRESNYFKANLAFMKERYGENLIKFTLHQDEKTPHFQCMVVPITDISKTVILKNGEEHTRTGHRLTAAELFSRGTLRELQTDYAQAMKPFGLERGLEKSAEQHVPMRRVYAQSVAVSDLEQAKTQRQADLNSLKKAVEFGNEQYHHFADQVQQLKNTAQQVSEEADREATKKQAEIDRLNQDRQLVQSQFDQLRRMTKLESDKMRAEIDQLTRSVQSLERQATQMAAEKQKLTEQTVTLQKTIDGLKSQEKALSGQVQSSTVAMIPLLIAQAITRVTSTDPVEASDQFKQHRLALGVGFTTNEAGDAIFTYKGVRAVGSTLNPPLTPQTLKQLRIDYRKVFLQPKQTLPADNQSSPGQATKPPVTKAPAVKPTLATPKAKPNTQKPR